MSSQANFSPNGQFCSPAYCFPDCDIRGLQSIRTPISLQGSHQRQRQLLDHSEMQETEDLLASEMNKLSVQERSSALDDIHCVGEHQEETPEIIEQSLREFDHYVKTIAAANRIYCVALKQNRSYVEDQLFRLKFLRANMFNARKAVDQMMDFLHQKALYFGESKVARDIAPGDMNREVVELMRSGFFQVLKDQDRSGRVILYSSSFNRLPPGCHIKTVVRVP